VASKLAYDIPIGERTYRVEEPLQRDGLRATVSLLDLSGAPIHTDRLNLDRAKDRSRFAAEAHVDPGDLLQVWNDVLNYLSASPTADPPTAVADATTQQAARALLEAPDLLDRAAGVIGALGYAGDVTLPKLVYLTYVSRLLQRPINLVVGGPSAAGKSFLVALVAKLFPAEATYALNGMSEKLLAYTEADLQHRVLIIGEAASLHRDGIGASLLRSIAWEGNVVYETVESTAEGLKPRRIEKPGPTGFVTTTTKSVEPELETRVLTVQVPDTKEATRVILLATAARANGMSPDAPDLAAWHEAQRYLASEGERAVTIPFSEILGSGFNADLIRSRRDFPQLLSLIQAHALLFQRQRGRDGHGRVVADERDYRAIFELAKPVFGAIAAEGVTPTVRETVERVRALCPHEESPPVMVTEVASALNIDKSAASRRVRAAIKGEFLVNEETRRGRPLRLRPGDPLPQERAALPDPDTVFADDPFDDPLGNRATVQPSLETSPTDGEKPGCRDGFSNLDHCNREASTVASASRPMQPGVQPSVRRDGAENSRATDRGCTVDRLTDEERGAGSVPAAPPRTAPSAYGPCLTCGAPLAPGRNYHCSVCVPDRSASVA
jgi:hypothetical protein